VRYELQLVQLPVIYRDSIMSVIKYFVGKIQLSFPSLSPDILPDICACIFQITLAEENMND
jgi:hypothetical protein